MSAGEGREEAGAGSTRDWLAGVAAKARSAADDGAPVGQLVVQVAGEATPQVHELTTGAWRIGRGADNDIVIDAPYVSRYQAVLTVRADGATLAPVAGALTPVVHAGRELSAPVELQPADYFRLPGETPGEIVTCIFGATAEAAEAPDAGTVLVARGETIVLGSALGSAIGESNTMLAPRQAEVTRDGDAMVLRELGAGTTLVDGELAVGAVTLYPGMQISAGSVRIVVGEGRLDYRVLGGGVVVGERRPRMLPDQLLELVEPRGGVELRALGLRRDIKDGVSLLDDVSLYVRPSEMVVLVGLSGAGKSTLLNALNGYRRASSGDVQVGGLSLYDNLDRFRSRIGYVPQRDIVHAGLTVFEALDYAARLRLPPGTTVAERRRRVDDVLDDLGLQERRDVRIAQLSGGQVKRVSIGVELVSGPQLLFLDEPTSGLDPVTETGLMQLLRRLSDQGRTVIIITHATKNVMLADKAIFMVPGGRIAWFGPPSEALTYFDRHRPEAERADRDIEFDQIYELLEDSARGTPEEWAARYRADAAHERYIARPLGLSPARDAQRPPPATGQSVEWARQPSFLRQLITLSQRNLKLVMRDRFALILILVAAPLLAMLDFMITEHEMFDSLAGSASRIVTNTNTMIVNAMLVGALAQMREIIKDRDIYRRERLVNLRIAPYVLSKVWLAAVLALYQAIWWVGIRYLAVDMPGGLDVLGSFYVTMVLVTFAGMMLGLFASTISPSEDAVALIVALLIIPQVLFSGAHLPAHELDPLTRAQMDIMPSRWAFEALVTEGGHGRDLATDACWTDTTPEERRLLSPEEKAACVCLGESVFTECDFPGIRSFELTTLPEDPEAAEDARQTAISAAEGRLEVDYQNYGPVYDVSVPSRWGALAIISLALTGIVIGIHRVKDRWR